MRLLGVVVVLLVSCLSFTVAIDKEGKRWAVLVAGSRGYDNYRHQADVCHAYQLLKKGGLKDENIIVFMYDDIAFDVENPRPGVIVNKPYGDDVYFGVPKDYTGDDVTAENFYAVILGNKTAITGGSGKVVDSGPEDYIFIYYADHGGVGAVSMPSGSFVYAKDFIDVLKKKYEAKSYKSMVIYIESCESGSMFEGLLPENWNIYGVTAANASQSSYATYCSDKYPKAPPLYDSCLGDVFSISWLEDSDIHDLRKETLTQQYEKVKRRTGFDTFGRSHVLQYGNKSLAKEIVYNYIGSNPKNENYYTAATSVHHEFHESSPETKKVVNQRDANLIYLNNKLNKAPEGSNEKLKAKKNLLDEISHREQVDRTMRSIAAFLFSQKEVLNVLDFVRPTGQPLVDDWDCLKMLVKVYEEHCGSLSVYARKYMRAMANMCNVGINVEKFIMALKKTCAAKTA